MNSYNDGVVPSTIVKKAKVAMADADVNKDGKVDVADIAAIINYSSFPPFFYHRFHKSSSSMTTEKRK